MTPEPTPKRLHIAAAFVGVINTLPLLVIAGFAALFGGSSESNFDSMETVIYIGFAFLIVGRGLARWWRFRYWIGDDEFRLLEGVLVRREVFIPFERIRTVEINEGLLQRIFGVVRLQVKTSATGTQADLTAISRAEAERLRRALKQADVVIEGSGEAVESEPSSAGPSSGPSSSSGPARARTRKVISIGELIAAGATSGQLGVVFAFAAWIINETAAYTVDPMVDWATGLPDDETTRTTVAVFVTAAVIVGLAVSFLGSIVATAVKYGQFTVERVGDELSIKHGLINRQTITLPLDRIQAIRFVQNPLRELTGSGALFVEAMGHAEEKGRSSELFPLLGRDELPKFLREFLPEFAGTLNVSRPPPRAAFRFFALPLSATIVATAAAAVIWPPWGYAALGLIPLVALSRWLAYRQNGIGVSERLAIVESRSLTARQSVRLPRRAVRSVVSSANLFQARRDLEDIGFTVASGAGGKLLIAHNIDRDSAHALLGWTPGSRPPTASSIEQ